MGMPKTDVNDLPSDNSKRFYSSNARKYFEMEDLVHINIQLLDNLV